MSADWTQRPEGGGRIALRLIRAIAQHGGRKVGRAFLYPIAWYFTLARGPERRASIAYLGRVLGRPARLSDGIRHVHTFAATILDRLFLLGGQVDLFDTRIRGLPELHAALDQKRGVLLFGSHLGSFEVLRVLARRRPDYRLKVVLDKRQSPALTKMLDELDPHIAANVIDASQDGPSIVMQIHQACSEGAMVALLVDRVRGGEPALPASFLGGPVCFPTSPWLVAAVLKVPVILAFGLYRGQNRYDLVFEPFADAVDVPRTQREAALSGLVERYAARLEAFARSAPYNWFNFYDVWKQRNDNAQDPVDAASQTTQAPVDPAAVRRRPGAMRGRRDA